MDPVSGTLSDPQRLGLVELVQEQNEKLFQAGADRSEQSFGLGCILVALPILVVAVVLNLLGIFNLILLLIVMAMGSLVAAGAATLLAFQARQRAITGVYQQEVEPAIMAYLSSHNLTPAQLDLIVYETLAEDAPLRVVRPSPLPDPLSSSKE